jgi:hypothetical protein
VVPKILPDCLKISVGLGGPLHDFSPCCLTVAIRRIIYDKDESKAVNTVLNLFHKYFCTSVLPVHVFLFIFVIPVVPLST